MFKKKDPKKQRRRDAAAVPEPGRAALPRRERPLHPRAQGSLASALGAPRQPLRHRRHGDRRRSSRFAITSRVDSALGALVVGGVIGWFVAKRVEMTQMPELVAAMHSLVGLAAVLIAIAVVNNPRAFGIRDPIPAGNRVELFIGTFVGAMTFSGSVIAFGKLAGLGKKFRLFSSAPVVFKGQHVVNLVLALVMIGFGVAFVDRRRPARSGRRSSSMTAHRVRARRADHHPDRRRRHAGRDLDAEQLLRLGGVGHRLLAEQPAAHRRRIAGRIVGRDPLLHHVQGDEPLVLQRHPRRLRRRRRRAPPARRSSSSGAGRARPTTSRSCWATPRA